MKFDVVEWFEKLASDGYCPALLNDDNGHWAVSFEGYQSVPVTEEPQNIETCFFVEERCWKQSIMEAVLYAKRELEDE